VKLLGAGGEPRKALRFGLKAGDTQTLEMTVKMDMDVIIGQQLTQGITGCPLMKMTANVRVKEVSKGESDCEMVVSDVRLADEQAMTPQWLRNPPNSGGCLARSKSQTEASARGLQWERRPVLTPKPGKS
jgi:hypothetical protein